MALLAWVKSKKLFLKIQEGIGDNLLHEDRQNGFVDYVLWSTFKPESLDLDSELVIECVDSGMVMGKEEMTARDSIADCYCDAFRWSFDSNDVVELMEE